MNSAVLLNPATPLEYPTYASINAMIESTKPEQPVYCWHPQAIQAAAQPFVETFPGHTLYAVKCNPHPYVLQQLYAAGIRHFDTASLAEIEQIKTLFPDATCYFMHPIKSREAIREAYNRYGIRHFVLDHARELQKISEECDITQCVLYVRIAPLSTTAVYDFSKKFGAHSADAIQLLQDIAAKGASPALSFHIGSQCLTPETFTSTLELTGTILEHAGIEISHLDVGGGFPANYIGAPVPPLQSFFEKITQGIDALNLGYTPVLLCEPGRALAVDACSLVVQVQLRKGSTLYINDGVYGSFSEVWTGKLGVRPELIRLDQPEPSELTKNFLIYGCSCDSVDVLPIEFSLPEDVQEGDWIAVHMMGAYSLAIASKFNGFYPNRYVVIADT